MSSHLSFDWAENGGSWELLDKAFEQAIQKSALAAPPGALPPAAPTPPPPSNSGGILSKIPGMQNMPGWGSGALIGAGVGAIGGALTDKKKRLRGALQGALLGGGVGAAAGHLASPAAPAKQDEPPPFTPVGSKKDVSNPVARDAVEWMKNKWDSTKEIAGTGMSAVNEALGSPITWGAGGVLGGRALARSGSKPINVLGSPNGGVPNAVPDHSTTLKQLGTSNVMLDDAVKLHATKQPGNAGAALTAPGQTGAATPLTISPQESHQNLINFNNPDPKTGLVTVQAGGKTYQMTPQQLNEHHRNATQAASGHSNLPTASGLKRTNALKRYGGNAMSGVGALTAGKGILDSVRSMTGGSGGSLDNVPVVVPSVDAVKNMAQMVRGSANAEQQIRRYGQRANWTPQWTEYLLSVASGNQ